ncbi:APC family permease [Vulcanisaeta distributa]|uniref:Amino acid permease-associated region n=1 Tax=Vulcanisaeta distributa (strain DSM 14429 / JCM 11212 / NBRC 100878 / IC-017) TaxID=572478 RepID=E1QS23_VULDI|nr:APC family permease [Vulcanisaeta distributa]ADN51855.1 amino acid permease-associated region [Vulcanisaeta distributa DSM 14429]
MAEDFGIRTDRELRRALDRRRLLFLSIGEIIGAGWLFAPMYAASYAGGAALLAWIIAGVIILLIAFANAEIASAIPKSGALVRYPHYVFGGFAGFLLGWSYFLAITAVPPTEALTATRYLSFFFPQLYNTSTGTLTVLGYVVAYLFLALFVYVNYMGVKAVGDVVYGVGWWKLLIPSITAIIMIALAFNPANFTAGGGFIPTSGTAPYTGWAAVFYAMPTGGVLFAYLGFRQAIEYGGEGRNPSKDIPFAVISAILIAMIIYMLLELAFIGAIHWDVIGIKEGAWSALRTSSISKAPIAQLLESLKFVIPAAAALLTAWVIVFLTDAVVSPAGTGFVSTGGATRALYGVAADGYLPSWFLTLSRTKIPKWSLITIAILGALYLLPFPTWQSIVSFTTVGRVLTYMVIGGIAVQALRRTAPELPRAFKLWAMPVLAPLATLAASLVIYWSGFGTVSKFFLAVFIGLPIYFGYYAYKRLNVRLPISLTLGLIDAVGIAASFSYFYGLTKGLKVYNDMGLFMYIIVTALLVYISMAVLYYLGSEYLRKEFRAGVWLPTYMIVITVLSYYGSFGLHKVIPFPVDTVIAAVVTLIFHYWAVYSAFRTKAIDQIIEEMKK